MEKNSLQLATFGAGCFWQTEEIFRKIPGVVSTMVGYEGGHMENPTYEDVCCHTTGHSEVVQITYDPAEVSYESLLNIFWENHNPTTLNRQGPDVGDNYRSVIFYHSDEQKRLAEKSKEILSNSGRWKDPIVTQIERAQTFYKAEEYHQKYLMKRGLEGCEV